MEKSGKAVLDVLVAVVGDGDAFPGAVSGRAALSSPPLHSFNRLERRCWVAFRADGPRGAYRAVAGSSFAYRQSGIKLLDGSSIQRKILGGSWLQDREEFSSFAEETPSRAGAPFGGAPDKIKRTEQYLVLRPPRAAATFLSRPNLIDALRGRGRETASQ